MSQTPMPCLQKGMLYYNNILNCLSQGVLFVDLRGIVTTFNSTAESFLGINSLKVIYQSFWDHFPDELFGFSMRTALARKKIENPTFIMVKSASRNPLRLEVKTRFIDDNCPDDDKAYREEFPHNVQGIIILIRDISEIKRLELAATRTDQTDFSEMAAMVAHEIRNPLGGIKGFAALLQRDLIGHPELEKLASYIVEGTDNLNRRVNDILDYSHTLKLSLKSIDLVQFMQELILHLNADDSIDPRIELRTHSPKAKLMAPVDAASLKSAILNLTSNAIQAMPDGGELNIEVDATESEAIIKVSDTGLGIPKENLEKVFSPFFTTRPKGHGLGLTEAHKIIQAHGGYLEVASDCGEGTTFTIRLPLRRKKSRNKI